MEIFLHVSTNEGGRADKKAEERIGELFILDSVFIGNFISWGKISGSISFFISFDLRRKEQTRPTRQTS